MTEISQVMAPHGRYEHALPAISRLLGWGNAIPDGLWFIGLEEHSFWSEKYIEQVAKGCAPFGPPASEEKEKDVRGGAQIRARTAQIASRLSKEFGHLDAGTRTELYLKNRLWQPGSGVCQANLFPLGKPDWGAWPDAYRSWFGFETVEAYRDGVHEARFKNFRSYMRESPPRATICFGKAGRSWFKMLFELENTNATSRIEGRSGRVDLVAEFYCREGAPLVVMTEFLGRPMTIAFAEEIASKLSDLGVQVP